MTVNPAVVEGQPVATFTYDGATYSIYGLESSATAKDYNENGVQTTITGTAVVIDANGADVTDQFDVIPVPGTLKIDRRTLKLGSKELTKKYDGSALTNGDSPLATESGWVNGEGATYHFTGKQSEIGESSNSFEITANPGTDLNNYAIEKTEGKLIVTEWVL